MCSDTSDIPCPPDPSRVGARVDLVSPEGRPLGKLIFLDPSAPRSATATHVRFVPHPTTENRYQDRVLVSI